MKINIDGTVLLNATEAATLHKLLDNTTHDQYEAAGLTDTETDVLIDLYAEMQDAALPVGAATAHEISRGREVA